MILCIVLYCMACFRYASLFFLAAIDKDDNELIMLEIIQRYVEVLDLYFGNVSSRWCNAFINIFISRNVIHNTARFCVEQLSCVFFVYKMALCRNVIFCDAINTNIALAHYNLA